MRRVIMGIVCAACCLAAPAVSHAQETADSLGSAWSLTRPRPSKPAPEGQEGRAALTSAGIVMGLGLYGWSIPVMTTDGSPTPQQAFEMYAGGAIASALLPLAVSTRWPVTRGAATLAANGAARGALHGALLFDAAGEDDPRYWIGEDPWSEHVVLNLADAGDRTRERRLVRYMVATSLGEAALGFALARTFRVSEGDAETITAFGDIGMVAGDAVAQWSSMPARERYGDYVFDEHLGEFVYVPPASNPGNRRVAFGTLAGGAAGQAAGALLASRRHYTAGGASLMRTTSLLGVYAGYCATWRYDDSPAARRRRVVGVLAGGATGLVLGDHFAAGRNVPGVAAVKVEAATLFGALLGGVTAAVSNSEAPGRVRSQDVLFETLSGGLAGFTFSYLAQVRHPHASAPAEGAWRLQLEPQGLLAASGLAPAPARRAPAPLLTLSRRLP